MFELNAVTDACHLLMHFNICWQLSIHSYKNIHLFFPTPTNAINFYYVLLPDKYWTYLNIPCTSSRAKTSLFKLVFPFILGLNFKLQNEWWCTYLHDLQWNAITLSINAEQLLYCLNGIFDMSWWLAHATIMSVSTNQISLIF